MKHSEKFMAIITFTLLAHYFVLNFIKVDGTENFVGKVEKIGKTESGIMTTVKVNFTVKEEDGESVKLVTKTISLIKDDLKKLQIGRIYKVSTHKKWLVTLR